MGGSLGEDEVEVVALEDGFFGCVGFGLFADFGPDFVLAVVVVVVS